MVQQWAGSHNLPRSDRTLGPQVPVLTAITQPYTDLGSPATDPCSPNIEDIPEEDEPEEPKDSAKPPRGHHEPPMAEDPHIPGALS